MHYWHGVAEASSVGHPVEHEQAVRRERTAAGRHRSTYRTIRSRRSPPHCSPPCERECISAHHSTNGRRNRLTKMIYDRFYVLSSFLYSNGLNALRSVDETRSQFRRQPGFSVSNDGILASQIRLDPGETKRCHSATQRNQPYENSYGFIAVQPRGLRSNRWRNKIGQIAKKSSYVEQPWWRILI